MITSDAYGSKIQPSSQMMQDDTTGQTTAIEAMSPEQAAAYLMACVRTSIQAYIEGTRLVAQAHPSEVFWLEVCEALEKWKTRPDYVSTLIVSWRRRLTE